MSHRQVYFTVMTFSDDGSSGGGLTVTISMIYFWVTMAVNVNINIHIYSIYEDTFNRINVTRLLKTIFWY